MNKAFTREIGHDEDDDEPEVAPPLPSGQKNYITPGGYARLKAELDAPRRQGAAGDRAHRVVGGRQRRPLRERRLHLRQEAPARDRPAHPLPRPAPRHRRGRRSGGRATTDQVLLRRDRRRSRTRRRRGAQVSIVGIDETDTARGYISWISPMARALLQGARRRHGDAAHARRRRGHRDRSMSRYEPLATGEAGQRPNDGRAQTARRASEAQAQVDAASHCPYHASDG